MSATSPAVDVATLLATLGHATIGVDLFVGTLPSAPDTCVAVFDTGGQNAEYGMGANVVPMMEQLTVKITVRGSTYAVANDKARDIHAALRNWSGTTNGITYALIQEQYAPIALGHDENRRTQFSLNYVTMRRP